MWTGINEKCMPLCRNVKGTSTNNNTETAGCLEASENSTYVPVCKHCGVVYCHMLQRIFAFLRGTAT